MQGGQSKKPKSNRISPEAPVAGQSIAPDESSNSQTEFRTDVWQLRGKSVSLKIQIDVIEKLQEHVLFGLKMSPPCDVRGILLGQIAKGSGAKIIVEDFELARYTSESGEPPPTQDERLALEVVRHRKAGAGARCVVGIFRSQRQGWLALTSEDLRGANHLFPRTENIFLIIGPSQHCANTAVVFFRRARQRRAERCYAEFPLNANLLYTGAATQMTWWDGRAEPSIDKNENAAPLLDSGRFSLGSRWGSAVAAFLRRARGIGARARAAKHLATQTLSKAIVSRGTAPARRPWLPLGATWGVAFLATMFSINGREMMNRYRLGGIEAPVNTAAKTLNLKLALDGELLEILWDPNLTELEAKNGTITITGRNSARKIQIDQTHIRAGHMYYRPPTGDLGIRIEVVAADGQTASGAVQLVSAESIRIKESTR